MLFRSGKRKASVLVVDVDSQCNTTSTLLPKTLDNQFRESLYEVFDETAGEPELPQIIYPTNCKNVELIPNVPNTANLEPDLIANFQNSFNILRKALRGYASRHYDYTLIDCPPNMGTFVMCALYASDFVIVPVKAGSTFSISGLIDALKLIQDVHTKGNPDLRFLRLLVNSMDRRTAISKAVVGKLSTLFSSDKIFKTQIPINTAFEKAEAMSQTVFETEASSHGAKAYRALAKELMGITVPSASKKSEPLDIALTG